MSLRAIVWVFDHSEATLGARLVLLTLAEYAHDDGTNAFPDVATIAAKTRMSRKGVQLALRKLEEKGEIEQTGVRSSGTRVYRLVGMGGVESTPLPDGGAKLPPARGEAATPDPSGPVKEDPYPLVREAWKSSAPPLIAHRDSYFETQQTKRAVTGALRRYGGDVEAVVAAIGNYATCLGSDEYRWTHSWTLIDFLARGLDKFVPEAQPLQNFRRAGTSRAASGGPGVADIG